MGRIDVSGCGVSNQEFAVKGFPRPVVRQSRAAGARDARRRGCAARADALEPLDRQLSLVENYGDSDVAATLQARDSWPDNDSTLTGGVDDLDDFSACRITRKGDWVDLYAELFYDPTWYFLITA